MQAGGQRREVRTQRRDVGGRRRFVVFRRWEVGGLLRPSAVLLRPSAGFVPPSAALLPPSAGLLPPSAALLPASAGLPPPYPRSLHTIPCVLFAAYGSSAWFFLDFRNSSGFRQKPLPGAPENFRPPPRVYSQARPPMASNLQNATARQLYIG
jgi:hypothetical protein